MFAYIADQDLRTAFENLSRNPRFTSRILELKTAKAYISIMDGSWTSKGSTTDAEYPKIDIYINNKDDVSFGNSKYGASMTPLETSIAHELGHAYFEYLLWEKKGEAKLLAGLPDTVDLKKWRKDLSEVMARRFENDVRPADQQVRLIDPTRPCSSAINELSTKLNVLDHHF
jgi:hypothetical protein